MPRSDRSRPALGFWRIALLFAAGVLGIAALCLVVFGDSQRQLQFGVLLGLWAFLIGGFLSFGSRRGQGDQSAALAEAERRSAQLHEAQLQVSHLQRAQLEAAQETRSKQEIELRKFGEMQLSREAAARREADLNLELSLRREIERMMTEQLGALRDEVAALRAEVVDKLGGQLRLERIETTRLIGSDLEALQHEIRRLAGSQESIAAGPVSLSQFAQPAPEPARAGRPDGHDIVDAEVIEPDGVSFTKPAAVPEPAAARPEPAATRPEPAATRPEPAATRPEPEAARPEPATAQPKPAAARPEPGPARTMPEPVAAERPAAVPEQAPTGRPGVTPEPAWSDRVVVTPEPSRVMPPVPAEPVPAPVTAEPKDARPDWSAPTVVGDKPAELPGAEPNDTGSVPPLYRQSEQVAAFTSSFDPFAGLPRLSPLPEDIELIQDPEPVEDEPMSSGRRRAPDEDEDRYHGRRRAAAEAAAEAKAEAAEQAGGRRRASEESGGRRRAPDDAPDDLLARLTER